MGCDIHLYVEKIVNGEWVTADKWTENKWYEEEKKYGATKMTIDWEDQLYTGRNYQLFSFLADVRNGTGFAGVDTGNHITPIAPPRGLPEDVSPELWALSTSPDWHSHSWFTVKKLNEANWLQIITLRGVVGPENFRRWDYFGKPEGWSGSVSGGLVKNISNEAMKELFPDWPSVRDYKGNISYVTQVEWKTLLSNMVEPFLVDTLPKLNAINPEHPEDVRIVFWFDN